LQCNREESCGNQKAARRSAREYKKGRSRGEEETHDRTSIIGRSYGFGQKGRRCGKKEALAITSAFMIERRIFLKLVGSTAAVAIAMARRVFGANQVMLRAKSNSQIVRSPGER
jgi:hypothetical protein